VRVCEYSKVSHVTPADDCRVTSNFSARVKDRRLKKSESLKENEDITKQRLSPTSRGTKFPYTAASRPTSANYKRSGVVKKTPPEQQDLSHPLYDYADHIPKPKVIYITNEDRANEMVPTLNG
jgi:hypothetical protein